MAADDAVPCLGHDNYSEWAIRMEAQLVRKKLWEVIMLDVSPPVTVMDEADWWRRQLARRPKGKMEEARAEIILKLDDSQLSHARERDPKIIRDTLARAHVARGFATRLALRRQFMRLVKKKDEGMSAWMGRVRALAWKLENVGVEMSYEDMILALTNGLDDTYEPFIISLDSTPPKDLTLEYVEDRMLNEEVRRGNKGVLSSSELEGVERETAFFVKAGGGRGIQGLPVAPAAVGDHSCWNCGEEGHIRAYCKAVPTAQTQRLEVSNLTMDSLPDFGTRELGTLY